MFSGKGRNNYFHIGSEFSLILIKACPQGKRKCPILTPSSFDLGKDKYQTRAHQKTDLIIGIQNISYQKTDLIIGI